MSKSIDRLVGDDGEISSFEQIGVAIEGDGGKAVDELLPDLKESYSIVFVSAKATIGSLFERFKIGEFAVIGRADIPELGDKFFAVKESILADAKGIELGFTKDSIDVTTLSDSVKKYRAGKTDMSGSLSFQTMSSSMEKGSLYNGFLSIVSINKDGESTISEVNSKPIFLKASLQRKGGGERKVFTLVQVELNSLSLSANMGSAQEYTSEVRAIGQDPILVTVDTVA